MVVGTTHVLGGREPSTGWISAIAPTTTTVATTTRLEHRLVVALADEPPQSLVLAEGRQRDQGDDDRPADRLVEQVAIAVASGPKPPSNRSQKARKYANATRTPSTSSCGTAWRWTGKAADRIRRRMRRQILVALAPLADRAA